MPQTVAGGGIRSLNASAYNYYAVFQFSRSGKFIRKVRSNGRASGEYTGVRSTDTDQGSETIYISFDKKVSRFDFKGNCPEDISTSLNPLRLSL
ncbi:MAG: 6-bladed beta-propeller [Bacteroidales bacterium]